MSTMRLSGTWASIPTAPPLAISDTTQYLVQAFRGAKIPNLVLEVASVDPGPSAGRVASLKVRGTSSPVIKSDRDSPAKLKHSTWFFGSAAILSGDTPVRIWRESRKILAGLRACAAPPKTSLSDVREQSRDSSTCWLKRGDPLSDATIEAETARCERVNRSWLPRWKRHVKGIAKGLSVPHNLQ